MENPTEKKILELFTLNEHLKFSEIENLVKERSNKIAYHLKIFVKKGILTKENEIYGLSETAENIIPYLSEKNSPLVFVLIRIGDHKRCFLHKRGKRPFKDKLSLSGGRLLVNETIKEAVKRIMKDKYDIDAKFSKVNSVNFEVVKRRGKRVHSFMLILVSANARGVELQDVNKNRSRIIKSDYQLITSPDFKLEIKEFITPA